MSMTDTAMSFFDACETGKGWAECAQYCATDASFSCQSQALADTHSLEAYTEWMKGLLVPLPDGHYELKGFAADAEREIVLGFAVFHGTHTAAGGPMDPTGNSVAADYVYAMEFAGGKVAHMTKIWNDGHSLQALGWAQIAAQLLYTPVPEWDLKDIYLGRMQLMVIQVIGLCLIFMLPEIALWLPWYIYGRQNNTRSGGVRLIGNTVF